MYLLLNYCMYLLLNYCMYLLLNYCMYLLQICCIALQKYLQSYDFFSNYQQKIVEIDI